MINKLSPVHTRHKRSTNCSGTVHSRIDGRVDGFDGSNRDSVNTIHTHTHRHVFDVAYSVWSAGTGDCARGMLLPDSRWRRRDRAHVVRCANAALYVCPLVQCRRILVAAMRFFGRFGAEGHACSAPRNLITARHPPGRRWRRTHFSSPSHNS